MASTFSTVPQDLRRAAGQCNDVATVVAGLKSTNDLSGVATAMPGSQSAKAASRLETEWDEDFATWAKRMRSHAASLRASAGTYRATDDSGSSSLRAAGQGL